MLDRTIPFYNTILKCRNYEHKENILPDGFTITTYQNGYEKDWARLEFEIGDFDSIHEAEKYFIDTYMQNHDLLMQNARFLVNKKNEVIGSCIAWQDKKKDEDVASLHWLIVEDKYQGIGLGKALCKDVMNLFVQQKRLPIYVHTQPWSYKAIFLYLSLGFKLQKTDTFANYTNEYDKALITLKKVISETQYIRIEELSEE